MLSISPAVKKTCRSREENKMKKYGFFALIIMTLLLMCACEDEPNRAPTVSITATPAEGDIPLSVSFRSTASDPENGALNYSWDFGDGSAESTAQNPRHAYTTGGVFTATCTVTDSGSPALSASDTATVSVNNPVPEVTSISPAWALTHQPEFPLTVRGRKFQPDSVIIFNGKEMETEYVSANELRCVVEPDDTLLTSVAGTSADETFYIAVQSSEPGGGTSNNASFNVHANYQFTDSEIIFAGSYEYPYIRVLSSDAGRVQVWALDKSDNYQIKVSDSGGRYWDASYIADNGWKDPNCLFLDDQNRWHYLQAWSSLYYKYSDDGMQSWSDAKKIYTSPPEVFDHYYNISKMTIRKLSNGRLYAVWYEYHLHEESYTRSEIYHSYSDDGGATWVEAFKPTIIDNQYSFPSIGEQPDGLLHFTCNYGSYTPNYHHSIIYQYSDDFGTTWSDPKGVSGVTGTSDMKPYAGAGGELYMPRIIDYGSYEELSFMKSTDHGQTWQAPVVITNANNISYHSLRVLSDSAGNLVAFYHVELSDTDTKLYFKRSVDGGVNWTAPEAILNSRKTDYGFNMDINGNLYFAWSDKYHHGRRIYFKMSAKNIPIGNGAANEEQD